MALSVRERTGELTLLKAVGFTDGKVLALVLTEAVSIAAIGGLLGLGLAWLMISAGDPTDGLMPMFFFPRKDIFVGVGLVLASPRAVAHLGLWRRVFRLARFLAPPSALHQRGQHTASSNDTRTIGGVRRYRLQEIQSCACRPLSLPVATPVQAHQFSRRGADRRNRLSVRETRARKVARALGE